VKQNKNTIQHHHKIDKEARNKFMRHGSYVIWFTGLSGSGKSTLAGKLEEILFAEGIHTYLLDGDNVRKGINSDLGFSASDREENLRRITELSYLLYDAGLVVLSAFISPIQADRDKIRARFPEKDFIEIYVDCSLEECENRDVKGFYKKARAGEIPDFTGISAPYEIPTNPECVINTTKLSLDACVNELKVFILSKIIQA